MPSRAYIIHGDIYYSPNTDRDVYKPQELNTQDIFTSNHVGVSGFEQPYWWSEEVPWLPFIPKRPVCWNGALVEDLGYMPRRLLVNSNGTGYMLPHLSQNRWLAIEGLIRAVIQILSCKYNIQFRLPYSTRGWGYTDSHTTEEQTWHYATEGRDWFAMWIAALYWLLKVIPEDPKYIEGACPTEWYRALLIWDKTRISAWESVRSAPLLQRMWDANRAGVFLHNPANKPDQPSPLWFDHCGIPVWYRWGPREIAQSREHGFLLKAPPPEILQAATTVLAPSVPPPDTGDNFSWLDRPSFDPPLTPASPSQNCVDNNETLPPSSPSHVSKLVWQNGRLRTVDRSGQHIWEPWHQKHEDRHRKMSETETPSARQARLNRERQPPTVSAAVYMWEWNFATPPEFVRTLVPKRDHQDMLAEARSGEARYDAFCNEWNICCDWFDGNYDDSDDEESHMAPETPAMAAADLRRPLTPPTPVLSATNAAPQSLAGELERCESEVMNVLTEFYGFVPPQAQSTNVGPLPPLADIKCLTAITGTTNVKINSAFWGTQKGEACISFARHLARKEGCEPPPTVWDLSSRCRQPLKFCSRLRCIKRVQAGTKRLYMFDLSGLATVPWHIAVYTASAALMICRLPMEFTDEDIAVKLAQLGVPFRTLQKRVDLDVVRDQLLCALTPMVFADHIFSAEDFNFWKRRCQSVLYSQRGRAAVLRGGYVRRLAFTEGVGVSEALRGPSGLHQNDALNFCAQDKEGIEYVDDELTKDELDLLCGVYESFTGTGMNIKKQSWYPLVSTFEGSGDDQGRWHVRLEEHYQTRASSILNEHGQAGLRLPLSATQWRDNTRGFGEARRAAASVEKWSIHFIDMYCSA